MADYNSIQAILDSSDNLVCLLNNSKKDDDTLNCPGVDWFQFNGGAASTIYYSGNSWMGFGASSEHLKVNRRDAAVYSFWREEGTLYGTYDFLRLKWQGYSVYSSTSTSERLTWEVILFSTGDIFLNVIDVPNTTGANSLLSYSFIMNTSNRQVSFYHLDDTGTTYDVVPGVIEIEEPVNRYFLVRAEDIIYTFVEGALTPLDATEMESTVFLAHGCLRDQIDFAVLQTVHDPEIYEWQAEADKNIKQIDVTMTGTALPQTVTQTFRLDRPDIKGIQAITTVYTGDSTVSLSVDGGVTYKAYLEGAWQEMTGMDGMSIASLELVTLEQWAELATEAAAIMVRVLLIPDSSVESITISYIN